MRGERFRIRNYGHAFNQRQLDDLLHVLAPLHLFDDSLSTPFRAEPAAILE